MQTRSFVVRDVRVFDGEKTEQHRSVLVEAGRIVRIGPADLRIPPGTAEIDGRDRTLLPGLIDGHVHISEGAEDDLRQALSLGVTTVLDMFAPQPVLAKLKQLAAADPPDIADVRTAGIGATVLGVPYEYGRVKEPGPISIQAGCWISSQVSFASLPEYLHLGVKTYSEANIRSWFTNAFQQWKQAFGSPAPAPAGNWRGRVPAPL